jgi:hypothetical protein
MFTKQQLIEHIGGSYSEIAKKLGYKHRRADNNIARLPDLLTERQQDAIMFRMRAKRIKIPVEWR